jgi:hypothetical protein
VLCREKNAFHVHGVDTIELRVAHLEEWLAAMRPAGVVDDDREIRARFLDQAFPARGLRDVGLHEPAADLARDLLSGGVDVVDDHFRAFLGEAPGDARAETGARRR